MHVVRVGDARPYPSASSLGAEPRRIMGGDVGGPEGLVVGISRYPAGARTASAAVANQTVYVVLRGSFHLRVDDRTERLDERDSVHLERGEVRELRNDGPLDAEVLTIVSQGR